MSFWPGCPYGCRRKGAKQKKNKIKKASRLETLGLWPGVSYRNRMENNRSKEQWVHPNARGCSWIRAKSSAASVLRGPVKCEICERQQEPCNQSMRRFHRGPTTPHYLFTGWLQWAVPAAFAVCQETGFKNAGCRNREQKFLTGECSH